MPHIESGLAHFEHTIFNILILYKQITEKSVPNITHT
jgi:hypothetical protein